MLRIVSCLTLASLVTLPVGSASAQSAVSTGSATQSTREYGARLESLSKLGDPQRELGAVSVRDLSGQRIGQVESVQTNTKGKAQSVHVALNTGVSKLVTLPAHDLRYDFAGNAVVADLSQSQIEAMP